MTVAHVLPPAHVWRAPWETMRWTDPQRELLASNCTVVVFWGGNGTGKSMVLAEMVRRGLIGGLVGQPKRETYDVILAGETWAQLGSTIGYLWTLTGGEDGGWWNGRLRFEEGALKGQRLQMFDLVGGPCPGSSLRCGTFSAGGRRLAGPRADLVVTDEPMPEHIYAELYARLNSRGGRIVIGFTPTETTATKLDYLWELVDDPGKTWARDIQVELSLPNVTPRGGLIEVPWMSEEEIARFEAGTPALMRPMRMGRSRVPISGERVFKAYLGPEVASCDPPEGARLGIGIDHGSKVGAERVVLVACQPAGLYSRVWVLDEWSNEARDEAMDGTARGIIEMLARRGWTIADVDEWIGDRAHGGDRYGGFKSNQRLLRALAMATGIDVTRPRYSAKLPAALRRIRVPRKYDRSVWDGIELLHRLMVDGRWLVDPRCEKLHEDLMEWGGAFADPHKDGIDAARYVTVALVQESR